MSTVTLSAGYIPLVDAAPLLVARDLGFAEEEGLALKLTAAPSWSTLRDHVALGRIEAAHMLSPVPVAAALGLGGLGVRLDALSVLSLNGNVIGVSNALAQDLRAAGYGFDFEDAHAAGRALVGLGRRLRLGVPFPFSMHAELTYFWLAALGMQVPQDLDIRSVPPSLMAQAIADDEIDAFCVGEPWGSHAVETGLGELLLPGSAIWSAAPEKILAVRHDWAEREPQLTDRLVRALWRAGRWLSRPENLPTASDLLARSDALGISAEIIDRALTGHLSTSPMGAPSRVPGFVEFHAGAAGFPWRSKAAWIGERLAARTGLDRTAAMEAARQTFRTDIYRRALAPLGVDLPGANEKVEGAILTPTPVASARGTLTLTRDAFFDGSIFDPQPGK
ncbi:ABC transporter substrate-binding protein [Fluviibacterium sp. DFM31]|uniref:ABC transporter substrate-binding protein n=1 Tax=Meridianimarinicoccus marinus TaxID=3231483 RepID=A0ABV3L625_9RHOB